MNIDKYKLTVKDEFNIELTKVVPKGKNPFKTDEETEGKVTEKFIGYFGSLAGALNKIANEELLTSTDAMALDEVLNGLQTLETRIELMCEGIKANHLKKGIELC